MVGRLLEQVYKVSEVVSAPEFSVALVAGHRDLLCGHVAYRNPP